MKKTCPKPRKERTPTRGRIPTHFDILKQVQLMSMNFMTLEKHSLITNSFQGSCTRA